MDRATLLKESKEVLDYIRQDIGEEGAIKFQTKYRIARSRCCNPKDKDFHYYQGKFHFTSLKHFFIETYDLFKESFLQNPNDISIDRIDGSKGYEPGNIRFCTMRENLQNKPTTIKCKMVDTYTNEEYYFNSIGEIKRWFKSQSGGIHAAYKKGRLYRKRYLITKQEENSVSTIEIGDSEKNAKQRK